MLLVVRVEWRMEEAEQILQRVGAGRVYGGRGPLAGITGRASTNGADPGVAPERFEFGGSTPPDP
jgi:hypothetical protein